MREARYNLVSGLGADKAKTMKLDYYLHETDYTPETYNADSGIVSEPPVSLENFMIIKTYAIEVVKTEAGEVEKAYISDVTADKKTAAQMIEALTANLVTPCCLREVLEDLCAET